MDAMQHCFEYGVMTMCSIPEFKILGSEADWRAVSDNTGVEPQLVAEDFFVTASVLSADSPTLLPRSQAKS